MSDWINRLTGEENPLTFTSPETGTVYTPYWRGTSVSGEKKVGNFSYPGFDGSQTQDLGIRGRQFPKQVWFSGPDYDIEASNFVTTLGTEKGTWTVSDPVWGELSLQLVTYNAEVQIVENGNIAVVTMQWVESQPPQSNISDVQSAENVLSQTNALNESSSNQFGEGILDGEKIENSPQLSLNSADLRSSLDAEILRINDLIDSNLGPLVKLSSDLFNQFTAIQGSIINALDEAEFQAAQVAGQLQQLAQLPAQVSETVQIKLTRYSSLLTGVSESVPTEASNQAINEASVIDLSLSAIMAGFCNIAINGEYSSRSEALQASEIILDAFATARDALESVQELFNNSDVDLQYRSQSSSYADLRQLVTYAVQFLLDISQNLKIEKIVKVSTERTPITLAAKYYGSIDEEFIDLIVNANSLKGKERILLNPVREIVVYV